MAFVGDSPTGGAEINLGHLMQLYVNGQKLNSTIAFRVYFSGHRRLVDIERYKEKEGKCPYYDPATDTVPVETFTYPAECVSLVDANA